MARPSFDTWDMDQILSRVEPYLKSGLPLSKACYEAHVPRSTIYYLMGKEEWFLDKIHKFQQFLGVLAIMAIFKELLVIITKQNSGEVLDKSDVKFLQWFALHSILTVEEFGKRKSHYPLDWEEIIHRTRRLAENPSN